jgi:hypothetical protein
MGYAPSELRQGTLFLKSPTPKMPISLFERQCANAHVNKWSIVRAFVHGRRDVDNVGCEQMEFRKMQKTAI